MVTKQIAAIFIILGGVFYIFGSLAGGALAAFSFGMLSGLGYMSGGGAASASLALLGFGILMGVFIIIGGIMINSDSSTTRKGGGALAIVAMIIGAIPTLAGLGIGFIFTLVGSVIGLTFKGGPDIVVAMAPAPASYAPTAPSAPQWSPPAPAGARSDHVNFCFKCGMPLYVGAGFCANCGAPVPL
jgi:hypothetical protein